MTDTPTRAAARYDSDDAGVVALPGYLDPIPGHVEPGDVFTFDASFAADVHGDRFVEVPLDDAAPPTRKGTKAELADEIAERTGNPAPDPAGYTRDELVAILDGLEAHEPRTPRRRADRPR